jgi:iron complex outermembrane receptor protein
MDTSVFKKLFTFILFFCALSSFAQERSTISGTITLNDGTPAEDISVALKGTAYSAVSGRDGAYEIRNVKAGTYIIRVSAVGIATVEENITLAAGETATKSFTLNETQQHLDEVVIEARGNNFTRKQSAVVSKMPLKDIENPQVYNTITSEVLKQQVVTNFDDALKNAPGVNKLWESTGRAGDGAGYYSLRGFAVQPTMVNGLPGITNGSPDPANIETIDVIKGPSGTLFGSSLISYGGLINVTTKRPFYSFGGNVSYTAGTYGLNRITADINTPLGLEKKAAVRLNAAYHTENSFQDAGFRKSIFLAPSFSYQVNDRLSFFINTEIFNGRSTNQTMLFLDRNDDNRRVFDMNDLKNLGYNHKRSYTSNDLYMDNNTVNIQGQMNYKLSDQWTSQTAFSRTSAKSEGYYSYLYEGTQYVPSVTEGIILNRYISNQNSETFGTDIQQNFIGDFTVAGLRNRIIVGLDYFNRNVVNNNGAYVGNGSVYIGNNLEQFNAALGITDPNQFVDDSGILSQSGTDALDQTSPRTSSTTKEEIFSAYFSDVINITPGISVMASLRADRFANKGNVTDDSDDYYQTSFSPKFGIVYQPILNKVALFANYMNGFINTAPGEDRVNNQSLPRTFEPEHANQFELGTKLNLFNDKLIATLSYYDIKVDNMVYSIITDRPGIDPADPSDDYQDTNYFQNGAQQNKGFEASIVAMPLNGWNILAGYSYNDSRLTEGDRDFVGHRPESAGPRNLVNLWTSYKFSQGTLNGFGVGFGANHASENNILDRNISGRFTLPEYTIYNASVFYNVNEFSVTLKVDNIGNTEYYNGWSTINPQRLRAFAANLTYNF